MSQGNYLNAQGFWVQGTVLALMDSNGKALEVGASNPVPVSLYIDPTIQVHKNLTYSSQQTGTDVWSPSSGKKIAVTSMIIGTSGTTAGKITLWFGDNADTTFSQGTDQVLFAASFVPSATAAPGAVFTPPMPVFCTTADRELHVTTSAAISFDLTIEGYEF